MIYKNHFRFKKCFNIASTTDEHISFYLNYHSVGYFKVLLLFVTYTIIQGIISSEM